MAEKSSNGRTEPGFPPMTLPFNFETLMELNRPALNAMAQMNDRVYDNIAAMNKSWATFLNRRLKEDLAMPQQLADETVHAVQSRLEDASREARTNGR